MKKLFASLVSAAILACGTVLSLSPSARSAIFPQINLCDFVTAANCASVKAASTSATTSDFPLVVTISPQGLVTNGATSSGQAINPMACWTVAALPTTNSSGNTYPCYFLSTGGGMAVTPVPAPGQGCTPFHIAGGSAASTNSTNVKNAAGTICDIHVINTTSTTYFLRLYNLAAAPTCSSATGAVDSIPIPNAAAAGAGVSLTFPMGTAYGTGIGFCLTGGGSDTDNTNAATGVYVSIDYK